MSQSTTAPKEWSADGLLDEIEKLNRNMNDRSLAFILGAGASVTSKIPSGSQLARTWLEESHMRQCLNPEKDLESWASEVLNNADFRLQDTAAHYSRIFELRFGGDPQSGYAALEAVMENAEPAIGYSVLANILATTRHKVVVTTNFDNLVADALAVHALRAPLIVGHESLAGFARPKLSRPLVAKIHRDLHLHPKNDQNGVDKLEQGWEEALTTLFQHCTPLVLGYGGNDGSLMGFLEKLPEDHIPGQLFWCYREGERPNERILKVVAKHGGVLVAIAGFDEFMVQLAMKLFPDFKLEEIAKGIEEIGQQRSTRYREQAEKLMETLAQSDRTQQSPITDKAQKAISRANRDESKWWTWVFRAENESDPDKRQAIYEEALTRFPNNAYITGRYAHFLANLRQNYDAAKELYKRALALDPNHPNLIGNYANFLAIQLQDYDAAETMYKRALELDPNHANNICRYATFLSFKRKDHEAAETMYKRALELDPNSATLTSIYAIFLEKRQDYDAAETMYKRALELNPNDAILIGNVARFMADQRQDYDTAETMYKRALELDPNLSTTTGDYANFLANQRQDYNGAEMMYKRALELDPNLASTTGNLANLLADQRQDYDAAEAMYKRALELDPDHIDNTCNYACLLLIKGGEDHLKQASTLVDKVIKLAQGTPSQTLAEALLYDALISELTTGEIGKSVGRLKTLFELGYERGSWDFTPLFEARLPDIRQERQEFYRALGDAILNADKVQELDKFPMWNETTPQDPFSL